MHLNVGSLYVEGALLDGFPAAGDSRGTDVIVTDLFNYGMPLLRYDLGDRIELAPGDCTCGRRSPLIRGIHGRVVDQITTPGGEWVDPFRIGNLLRTSRASGSISLSSERPIATNSEPSLIPFCPATTPSKWRGATGPCSARRHGSKWSRWTQSRHFRPGSGPSS